MYAKRLKAAIYVPVATADEDQDTQMAELLPYAVDRGWKVLEYRERCGPATRPVLNRMMSRLHRHKFDLVLVASMDCLARSLPDCMRIWTV